MAIVPRGFDDTRRRWALPVLAIPPCARFVPLECSDGTKPTKAIARGAVRKATRVAELGGDGQRRQIVDAAEAPQALRRAPAAARGRAGRGDLFDGPEAGDGLLDGPQIGAVRLLERGERPGLGPQPGVVPLGPRLLRGREPPAMAERIWRAGAGAQQVRANVFAAAQEIARRFFLLGRNVNGGQRTGAMEHRELAGVAAIVLTDRRPVAESGRGR